MKLLLYLSHFKCTFIARLAEAIWHCLGEAESGVCGLYVWGTVLRGVGGACPQKDFTEVLLQRFEALLQVPSIVSLLFICYVLYTMSSRTWYDYTVALSIRLLLYLSHHKCVYRIRFNFCGVKLSRIADFSNFRIFIFTDAGS